MIFIILKGMLSTCSPIFPHLDPTCSPSLVLSLVIMGALVCVWSTEGSIVLGALSRPYPHLCCWWAPCGHLETAGLSSSSVSAFWELQPFLPAWLSLPLGLGREGILRLIHVHHTWSIDFGIDHLASLCGSLPLHSGSWDACPPDCVSTFPSPVQQGLGPGEKRMFS